MEDEGGYLNIQEPCLLSSTPDLVKSSAIHTETYRYNTCKDTKKKGHQAEVVPNHLPQKIHAPPVWLIHPSFNPNPADPVETQTR